MSDNRLNSIFTSQEVLISCSSLRTLDLHGFINQKKENKGHINGLFMDQVITNIRRDISENAIELAARIKKTHPRASVNTLISEVLLNRRYRRGTRTDNNPEMILEKITKRINQNKPIELTISLFPCKIPNRLKTIGILPDIAEIASLAKLAELARAVKELYEPGLIFYILTDGKRFQHILHFRPEIMAEYQKMLQTIVENLGVAQEISLIEYVDFLHTNLAPEKKIEKQDEYKKLRQEYVELVGETINPTKVEEYIKHLEKSHSESSVVHKIIHLFYSLLYSNYFPEISESSDSDELTRKVFEDIFDVSTEDNTLNDLRKKIITDTWTATIDYVAEIASGRVVKPVEFVFPESIRCDMHNIPDRLTLYPVDRSTTLTAFHGTGYIDHKLHPGVRYRISLQNEHFVPVYGKCCGVSYDDQPIFYIHESYMQDGSLSPDLASEIHLK